MRAAQEAPLSLKFGLDQSPLWGFVLSRSESDARKSSGDKR